MAPALKPPAPPEDDPLARQRDRVMYALSILAAVFLVPFAVHDLVKERAALSASILLVVAAFGVDGWALRRRRKPPIPYAVLLLPITAAIALSLATQGVIGAFWCYPVVLFFFFVLPQRLANVCSAALLVAATLIVYRFLTVRITVRFAVSLLLTIVMVNVIQNIIRELQRRLLEQAITDPLTGAFNRRHMGARLAEALEGGALVPSALLLIDVDHFKRINDEHGHDAGDAVLKGIVSVVRGHSRASDLLFRMGGEEFVLLLPGTRDEDAMAIADEIREAIAAAPLLDGVPVTASIGVGVAHPRDSVESWIKGTDAAMYEAKESGRNRVARRIPLAVCVLASLLAAATLRAQTVGPPLPKWTPGTLDIHQINTGRGNAGLLVFPDGTTMLLDAGDGGNPPPRGTPPRPDGSQPTAEWIARYLRALGVEAIDYGYLTHFHDDHMNAIVDLASRIPIRTMIDRGFPDYRYPAPDHRELLAPAFLRYREWLARGPVRGDRLRPGRRDQIVLVKDAARYPDFEVRNVAANGEVWTGEAAATRSLFPPLDGVARDDWPTENMCSLAIRVRYGRFDYFSGGDMPGTPRPGYPAWQDVETAVARAVGPVDVAILDHHGNRDSTNAALVSTLRPRAWIIPVWSADHPGHDVLDRMYSTRLYPGPRDVFATNMLEANRLVIGPLLDRLLSAQGHIVVRVAPGGASYQVVILDDSAGTYAVKAVHGPYESR